MKKEESVFLDFLIIYCFSFAGGGAFFFSAAECREIDF